MSQKIFKKSWKTIVYCSLANNHNLFRNFWTILMPGSGIYAKEWYPESPLLRVPFIISENTSKVCFKHVMPWEHKQSDFAEIWYKDTNWHFKQNYKILLRLIDKLRHCDVITVLKDSIFPKRSSEKVLPWIHNQTFSFTQISINFHDKSSNLFELYFCVSS